MPVTLTLHYDAADVGRHGGVVAARRDVRRRILAAAAGRGRRHAGQDGLGRDHAPVAVRDRRRGGGQDVRDRAGDHHLLRSGAPLPAAAAARPSARPRPAPAPPTRAAQYPGSAMDSCIDGAKGYTASCCFAANAPICFGVGAGAGCTDPGTGAAVAAAAAARPARLRRRCATAAGRVRRLSGRDAAGVHEHRERLRGRLLLPARSAGVCRHHGRAPVRRHQRRAAAAAARRRRRAAPTVRRARASRARQCSRAPTLKTATRRPAASRSARCRPRARAARAAAPRIRSRKPTAASPRATAESSAAAATRARRAAPAAAAPARPPAPAARRGGVCAPGAACQPGQRCGDGSPAGACMECTCDGGGHLACTPCPDKPDGGGAGATTGAGGMTGGGGGATTGTGGTTGGVMREPGATCQPGQRCGDGSPTGACMECTCDGGGHLACMPCPDKPDGGGAGATTGTGGMTRRRATDVRCARAADLPARPALRRWIAGRRLHGVHLRPRRPLRLHALPDKPGRQAAPAPPQAPPARPAAARCASPGATCQPGQRCGGGSPGGALHGVHLRPQRPLRLHALPHGYGRHHRRRHRRHHGHRRHRRQRHRPVRRDVDARPRRRPAVQREEYCPDGSSYRVRCDGATGACTCIATAS